jgi:hypothetical protein
MRVRAIGLLAEAYSKWERRAPLTPSHVERLVKSGVDVLVQPSTKRVFTDGEYAAKGARITPDLSPANTIMGVKQPLNGSLLPDKTYLFFSHVIKGQPQNMALLDEVLSKRCRLVDYECIREGGISTAPRLVAFGTFAGKSGVVNGLRGLGLRLLDLGHSSPFLHVGAAHSYAADCATLHASECICVHLIGLVIGLMIGLMVGLTLFLTVADTWTTSMTRGARCGLSGSRCARTGWDRAFGLALHASAHHGAASNGLGPSLWPYLACKCSPRRRDPTDTLEWATCRLLSSRDLRRGHWQRLSRRHRRHQGAW